MVLLSTLDSYGILSILLIYFRSLPLPSAPTVISHTQGQYVRQWVGWRAPAENRKFRGHVLNKSEINHLPEDAGAAAVINPRTIPVHDKLWTISIPYFVAPLATVPVAASG